MAQSKDGDLSKGSKENLSKYLQKLDVKDKFILDQLKTNNDILHSVDGKVHETKAEIIRTRDALIASVQAESETLIGQLETMAEKNKSSVSAFNTKLQSDHDKIQDTMKTLRAKTEGRTPAYIDKLLKETESKNGTKDHDIVTLSIPKLLPQTEQTTPTIGKLHVEDRIVNLPTPADVKVVKHFRPEVHAAEIRAISPTQMWCGYFGDRSLLLYNIDGQKLNSVTLKFDITGFAVNEKGNFIACDRRTESIKEITLDGQVTTLCKTSSMGICLNHKQQPVVCVLRSLVVYSTDCQNKLRIYKFDNDQEGNHLFVGPQRVSTNGPDYYCVADTKGKKVVTIDVESRLMWTYSGGPGQEEFKPIDVCCDSHMNVIVADTFNNKVHLLTKDGRFIMYITDRIDMEKPWGLSISEDDTLWIGECSDFNWVHVIKYLK
ncbi:hypothetical protein FSP39_009193 [Pinctada imbricata]|uniref:Tripartite motif-containing protein 2 n=1 Tax=Pinctada imbricata TaxID=66713 RepID=A0AA89C174_PINIB|nr:hypothetical protein FSP39_009193 [Pinctada imbricata]